MRVQELTAVGFQNAHGLDRRERKRRPPSVDDDIPVAAVDGGDHLFWSHGVRESAGEVEVDGIVAKEGRAHDDSAGAVCEHLRSALDAPDAAAHAAGKSGADRGDELAIVALALGRIQVDELYSREAREAGDPRFRVGCFDGEFLALHELDDVTVLEVDGGNQHAGLETNRDVMVAQVLLQL